MVLIFDHVTLLWAKMALKIPIIPYMGNEYMGIHCLAITQQFFANRTYIFIGTQETIIYRLVMRNHDF